MQTTTTIDRSTWVNKGRAGKFNVWHAGKNSYFVTNGSDGPVIGHRDQYGRAFTLARDEHDYEQYLADQENAYEERVSASYAARGQANVY